MTLRPSGSSVEGPERKSQSGKATFSRQLDGWWSLMLRILMALILLGQAASAWSQQDPSGLKISAAVDMVAQFKDKGESSAKDKAEVREAEFLLVSPIDHVFKGQLAFAAHQEGGEAVLEIHEAYMASSVLIPRSNLRFGQYFLGIGRLNRFHRHEWPMIETPLVHKRFFDEEGVLDTGIEYSYLVPVDLYLEVTAGVTNGFVYGHSHSEGEKPKSPTQYARVASSIPLPLQGYSQIGINYLTRTDSAGLKAVIFGSDFTAKWRTGRTLDFLLQGEVYQRSLQFSGGGSERNLGGYLIPQFSLGEVHYVGLLFDFYTNLDLKDVGGQSTQNSIVGLTPTYTLKVSEFSTLRLAHQTYNDTQEGREKRLTSQWLLQATYIIGAHPAHDF
jgi:hypothetical protein